MNYIINYIVIVIESETNPQWSNSEKKERKKKGPRDLAHK